MRTIKERPEAPYPINWVLWKLFWWRSRYNFLLPAQVTYRGRFYLQSKRMKFPEQRIYFSASDPAPFDFSKKINVKLRDDKGGQDDNRA